MDLLAPSGSSVPAEVGRNAVRTWQHGGDLWGLKTVALILRRWEPLEAVGECGDVTATATLPWMLSVKGAMQNAGSERGLVKVSRLTLVIETLGLWRHNDVRLLTLFMPH